MRVAGVDLEASTRNPTTIAFLDGRRFLRFERHASDEAILAALAGAGLAVVGLDAPLTLPDGRTGTYANRAAERAAQRAGLKAAPLFVLGLLPYRGIALAPRMRKIVPEVLEVFPRGTLVRLGHAPQGTKRHPVEVARAREVLALHVEGLPPALADDDEADAVAAALTAALHLEGATEPLGDLDEGVMWVPRAGLSAR